MSSTPTPPPVVVTAIADQPPAQLELDDDAVPAVETAPHRFALVLLPLVALACLATAVSWRTLKHSPVVAEALGAVHIKQPPSASAPSPPAPAPSLSARASSSSNWTIKHDGYVPIDGGVLHTPKTFVPEGGHYDLVIHFHGDVQIVRESMEHAGINAAVAIINLGIRSGPYREAYQQAGRFEKLLAQIEHGLLQRGVANPQLNRMALTSWSAGYGAIESILEHRNSPSAGEDPLDAVISLDGVHAAFVDGDPKRINKRSVQSYINVARAAADNQLLLILTHSEIEPIEYASAERTQHYILDQIDAAKTDTPILPFPKHLSLTSAAGAVAAGKAQRMVPKFETRVGSLRVSGYRGNTREHHTAHLTQMAAVALPELARRWAPKPKLAAQ